MHNQTLPREEREKKTGVDCTCKGHIVKNYYLDFGPLPEIIGPGGARKPEKKGGRCYCKSCGLVYEESVLKRKPTWRLKEG